MKTFILIQGDGSVLMSGANPTTDLEHNLFEKAELVLCVERDPMGVSISVVKSRTQLKFTGRIS